ncbi:MAG: hypothetical protein ACI4RG_00785 [Huintestinicola sp.]
MKKIQVTFMKKIIWVFGCLLALTACSGAEEAPAVQTAAETSAETEIASETEFASETKADDDTVHKTDGEAPPRDDKREFGGELIRVTAVDGDVITGEKMRGGRGFGGGRHEGKPSEMPEGEPPAMPEDGSMPEGEAPAMPENGTIPENGDKNFGGEAPQNETVTFTITDSTVMEVESISEGDMITVEMNEDGTAASVKAADMPVQTKNEAVTEQ